MRISNGVRRIEDGSIKTMAVIKPKASWMLRKTAMTATVVFFVPVGAIAGAIVGAVDNGVRLGIEGVRAIKEV